MDDLQAIALGQAGFSPPITGNDAPIQFNGDAVDFHPQPVDKTDKSQWRIEIPRFTIDDEVHRGSLRFHFAQLELAGGSAAGVVGLHQHGGIRERGFVDVDLQFGIAVGTGDHLGVERSRIGTGEANR
jgi:hypothetical protein